MYQILPMLIIELFFARCFTSYDSRFSKGKYITVKNKRMAKLLIDRQSFFERRYTLKKDRNKMSVMGLIFYLCVIFLFVITLFFDIIPPIPCDPFGIDTTKMSFFANTINQKVPILLAWIVMCVELFYIGILSYRAVSVVGPKWIKCFVFIIFFVTCIIGGYMLLELFKW